MVVRFEKSCEPEVALVPLQLPEAVHDDALVEDQVMVEELPYVTVVGFAEIVTVGAGAAGVATEKVTAVLVLMFPAVSLQAT